MELTVLVGPSYHSNVPKMTGGKFVAEFLNAYGVEAIFFVPNILSRALASMEDMPIRRVLAHSEKAAVYMADGYARVSRKPGICASQAIGASNTAAGLRDAFLAHSPVISMTGGGFPEQKHKKPYQEIADYPVFEPLTKANFQVDQVQRLPDLMRQAFREAVSGAPGPVNLQLAGLRGNIEDHIAELELIVEPEYSRVPAHRPEPEREQIRKALAVLQAAQKPVVIAGGGVRWSGAGKEVLALAEKLGIPIATAMHALEVVPESHPLYIGVPGSYSRTCTNKILHEADVVLYVGSQTGSQVSAFWQVPPPGTAVIQIGIEAGDLGRNYPNRVSLLGDAKVTLLRMLSEALPAEPRPVWMQRVRTLVEEWRSEIEPLRNSEQIPMRPERMMREVSRMVPDDAIVVSDTGHIGMWAAQQLWVESENIDFIRAAGSLGWGFPASLGAKCAAPTRPVICLTGDGGFWYHLQEIETAVRAGIHTVTVVNNNRALNQEIYTVKSAYEGRVSDRDGEIWKFSDVNLARVAESLGGKGFRVEQPCDIGPAIEQALACGAPAVVEVMTDIDALAPLAWIPTAAGSGH
jgi:acetolactate synthase-1/2/3 large subunit